MFRKLFRMYQRRPHGVDGYPLDEDDPYTDCHLLVTAYLEPITEMGNNWWAFARTLLDKEGGQAILNAEPALQVRLARTIAVRWQAKARGYHSGWWQNRDGLQSWVCLEAFRDLLSRLMRRKLPFTHDDLATMVRSAAQIYMRPRMPGHFPSKPLLSQIERHIAQHGISPSLEAGIREWLRACRSIATPYPYKENERLIWRLESLLGEQPEKDIVEPGEAWTDAILADLKGMAPQAQKEWQAVFIHANEVRSTRPSAKWRKAGRAILSSVDEDEFRRSMLAWLPLVGRDRGQQMTPAKADLLKGLVWFCAFYDDKEVKRLLADIALASYHKVPQQGARAMKAGNACIYVLGELAAVGQLVQLRLRVKYREPRRLIERMLAAAGEKAGVSSSDLEEISVPTFGLDAPGVLLQAVGEHTAELRVTNSGPALAWRNRDGKSQKSVPAVVKREHADALKALKRTAADIKKMLPAQRARLESLLIAQDRHWTLNQWRERYLDHPFMASLARRLIWHFQLGEDKALGIWHDGQIVDVNDRPLDGLSDETVVRPWHPLGFDIDVIREWRAWLLFHELTQPFKQAHREIYLLTDAELETEMYSNRFAAQLLRQHQLAALCRERGWQYSVQGAWDSHNVPTLYLPDWGIYAEFWVEMVMDGNWHDALSTSGVALYVTTDQVRFYNQARESLPLIEVPAIPFSEVMRDVDLFVGVCSVGNDPNWIDRGERAGYGHYWHNYAFGDLSVSAQTRKEVLERLLPRLKIADQCRFEDKFLVVEGKIRSYKIHLGSGNILMEPNNQYLCIVPDRRATATKAADRVFLPFEGDAMTSIILSKAFLLAQDDRIKDKSILRQIKM